MRNDEQSLDDVFEGEPDPVARDRDGKQDDGEETSDDAE